MRYRLTPGIPISKAAFDGKVDLAILALSQVDAAVSNEQYLELVRIYNTIDVTFNSSSDARQLLFTKLFDASRIDAAVKSLGASLTKGMCYYSAVFDIFIGGRPHHNSMYNITDI